MVEIEKNEYNLNISRYIGTAVSKVPIDLKAPHRELMRIDEVIAKSKHKHKHNEFLK